MHDYDNLKEDIGEIKIGINNIFKILNGNGYDGLVTNVALNRVSVKRLWCFVSIVVVSLLAGVGYLFAKVIQLTTGV